MRYDAQVTLSIPETIREIANKIGKAFDPDTGGEHTFDSEAIDGTITVTFPCVQEFAEALPFFAATPEALHASVTRDYEQRWPELTPPSLAEITQFCESVLIQ